MEIIDFTPDMLPISKPGIYRGIPIDTYHSPDLCVGPSFSSSMLRKIYQTCPAKFWATSSMNPKAEVEPFNQALTFGRAAHALILGDEVFYDAYSVLPEKFSDYRTKEAQAWRAREELNGKAVIKPKDLDLIEMMSHSLARHPYIRAGLMEGEPELSMIWQDPVTGLWLKSRPDMVPTADGITADFKTMADASDDGFWRAVDGSGYDMQGAMVGVGLNKLVGVQRDDFTFVIVGVEKEPPCVVNVQPLDANWILRGRGRLRRAIDTAAVCLKTGVWPGYAERKACYMPAFLMKQLESDLANSIIPNHPEF